jgi:hypothetical protein
VRSIARAVAPAAATPTDAHDVVGCPAGIRNDRRRGGERSLRVAEVDVEIFELAAPAAAEGTLEAGAGGPSGLHVLEGPGCGTDVGHSNRCAILDLAIRNAERSVGQDIRTPQDAKAGPGGPKPVEFVVGGDRGERSDDEGRAALLAGGLNVGFKTPHPRAELVVVAGLKAADDAVDVLRPRYRANAAHGEITLRLAPAVSD